MRFEFNWNPWAAKKRLKELSYGVLREAAYYCAERARYHAPVDTGRLRDSIIVVSALDTLSAGVPVFRVVATAPYARVVELGHYTIRQLWVPPNPFMRYALADTRQAFPALLRQAKFRAGSSREVSKAKNPIHDGYRNVTFDDAADAAAITGAGEYTGGTGVEMDIAFGNF